MLFINHRLDKADKYYDKGCKYVVEVQEEFRDTHFFNQAKKAKADKYLKKALKIYTKIHREE